MVHPSSSTARGVPKPCSGAEWDHVLHAARRSINTRIVLLQYSPENALGLILEQASQVARLPMQAQQPMGLNAGGAYLGSVQAQGSGDIIQRISIAGLLPPDVVALLFPAEEQTP